MELDTIKSFQEKLDKKLQQGDFVAFQGAYLMEISDMDSFISLETYVEIQRQTLIELNRALFLEGDKQHGIILDQLNKISVNARFFIRKEFVLKFKSVKTNLQDSVAKIIPIDFKKRS